MPGTIISEVELTNVSMHGFWIFVNNKEYLLPFKQFPWFAKANIAQLSNIEIVSKEHLYWPHLDIDLTLDMIENPDKYPLVSK